MSKKTARAKVADQVATAKGDGFVPSKGDETYLTPVAPQLVELAEGIRHDLNRSALHMLMAGDKLREARKIHKADQAYGKWCKKEFPKMHRNTLAKLVQVANDGVLRKGIEAGSPQPWGTITELISAPEELKEAVMASKDKAGQKETRAKVKEAKASAPSTVHLETEGTYKEKADAESRKPSPVTIISSNEDIMRDAIQSVVTDRILAFMETGDNMTPDWAFFIYGVMATWEDDDLAPNRDETMNRIDIYQEDCHPDGGGSHDIYTTLQEATIAIETYYQ